VRRTFKIDGIEHLADEVEACRCNISGRVCKKCGTVLHIQPVYGGQAEVCDFCDAGEVAHAVTSRGNIT
jgi:hypothetical protein